MVVLLVVVELGRLNDQNSRYPVFRFIFSLFNLNETTGCRMDAACELDTETLHTSEAKLPGEQTFHVRAGFMDVIYKT